MIFRVMFKTPDALDPVIDNLCHTSSCGGPEERWKKIIDDLITKALERVRKQKLN